MTKKILIIRTPHGMRRISVNTGQDILLGAEGDYAYYAHTNRYDRQVFYLHNKVMRYIRRLSEEEMCQELLNMKKVDQTTAGRALVDGIAEWK